ncbi:MAG: RtcB family protein [Bacteroidales bacterium]|nr:RtcB family protein [Bacteroidales bacterium]
MEIIRNNKGIETIIFAKTLDPVAYDQIKTLANSEAYSDSKIRIMPDAHAGMGCTIGTTMTISDKITPNLVGVDIGCGVLTIKLKNKNINFEKLDKTIRAKVPNGFSVHKRAINSFDFSNLRCQNQMDIERAMLSIGSLGGGNHFIEMGKSEDNEIYLTIHSGSRKLGNDVCRYYQQLAIKQTSDAKGGSSDLMQKQEGKTSKKEKLPKLSRDERDLAYLEGSDFDDYLNDMAIVQKYASFNRENIAKIIIEEMGFSELERFETIHNYIDFNRMILRKGAVSAELGEKLIIPINMRDGSLLCVGKGNENWNYSAPHGAGRLLSRTQAKKQIDMQDFQKSMKNIFTSSVSRKTLDEAPQAYKTLDEIKSSITETADLIAIIKPVYNFKAP